MPIPVAIGIGAGVVSGVAGVVSQCEWDWCDVVAGGAMGAGVGALSGIGVGAGSGALGAALGNALMGGR